MYGWATFALVYTSLSLIAASTPVIPGMLKSVRMTLNSCLPSETKLFKSSIASSPLWHASLSIYSSFNWDLRAIRMKIWSSIMRTRDSAFWDCRLELTGRSSSSSEVTSNETGGLTKSSLFLNRAGSACDSSLVDARWLVLLLRI